ncbi:MAG: terminase large subunit [Alphaproteobacteria bacterium]
MGRADQVIAFIEGLRITAGADAGKPFILRDWQRDIIRAIYDPVDENGRRLARTALLTMGRKNGKTALASALCLCHLFGPESEERGQVYSAAADRSQAAIIFNEAAAMVRADPELDAICNIVESTKRIVHYRSGSFYQAVSSESRTAHGFSASCIIYDELAQAPNRKLFDVLTTSTAARSEPLTIVISTVAADPNHIMSELVEYGRKITGGILDDPTFKPFIFEVPPEADPWDEANWRLANPALGDFRSLQEMRQYAAQAQRIPARESTFRALYLNQAVDAEARFLSSTDWLACAGSVDAEALRGRPCWGGLDLSSTRDLTAFVLYFPEDGGAVLPYFWVPGDRLDEREDRDRVPYRTWARQGHIEATPGRAIDKLAIAFRLAEAAATFDIRAIAYDRWRVEDLMKVLSDEGISLPLNGWGQGFKDMAPAVDALEAAVLDGRLTHPENPVLTWCASNAVLQIDPAGARKIAKDRSVDRVDGLVALAMAIGIHSREPGPVAYDFSKSILVSV